MTYTHPDTPVAYLRVESHKTRSVVLNDRAHELNDEEIFKTQPSRLNRVIDFMSAQLMGSSSRITSLDRFFILDGLSQRGELLGVIDPDQSIARFEAFKEHLSCVCEPEELSSYSEQFRRPYRL